MLDALSKIISLPSKILESKHGKLKFCVIIGLLLFGTYNFYIWLYSQTTDNAYVDGDITFVSPEVSGVIEKIHFVGNQFVKKGDLLVKIKDTDFRSKYESAKNAFEAGKIAIDIIDSEIEVAKINLSKTQDAVNYADLNLQNELREYNRISKLEHDNFSSKKLLDEASLQYKKAQSELSQAKLSNESASLNLLVLESKKQAQVQTTKGLEHGLDIASSNLNNTEIKSPIDGVVTSSGARVGGYASTGFQLFAVVPRNDFSIKANFKETQVGSFKPGQTAYVYIDALKDAKFKGKIRNIYPATGSKFSLIPTDNATGNFTKIVQRLPVIIDIEVPEEYKDRISIGLSVYVSIRTDQ